MTEWVKHKSHPLMMVFTSSPPPHFVCNGNPFKSLRIPSQPHEGAYWWPSRLLHQVAFTTSGSLHRRYTGIYCWVSFQLLCDALIYHVLMATIDSENSRWQLIMTIETHSWCVSSKQKRISFMDLSHRIDETSFYEASFNRRNEVIAIRIQKLQ